MFVDPTVGVTVQGAGCDKVNGTYSAGGEYGGRPFYKNHDTGLEMWYNEGVHV